MMEHVVDHFLDTLPNDERRTDRARACPTPSCAAHAEWRYERGRTYLSHGQLSCLSFVETQDHPREPNRLLLTVSGDMLFLSELLNNTVRDSRNDAVGKCVDVYVNPWLRASPRWQPSACSVAGRNTCSPHSTWCAVDQKGIVLSGRLRDLVLYEPQGGEISLAHQVLDRQIIDINGKRVVRVNDLQFAQATGKYRLSPSIPPLVGSPAAWRGRPHDAPAQAARHLPKASYRGTR